MDLFVSTKNNDVQLNSIQKDTIIRGWSEYKMNFDYDFLIDN